MTDSPPAGSVQSVNPQVQKRIDEHDVTVYLGDVRDVLASLPAQSVQCIVTSPPYYGLRDYGVDGQIGLEASPAEYVETMRGVFADVRRVLADDGVLWLNLGDSYSSRGGRAGVGPNAVVGNTLRTKHERTRPASDLPHKNLLGIPWRVAFALQDDGWLLRNAVVWHKPNAMPESVTDRLSGRYEPVFMFAKSARYTFDLDAIREPLADESERTQSWARDESKDRSIPGYRTQKRPGRSWQQRKAEGAPLRRGINPSAAVGDSDFDTNPRGRNPGDVWSISTQPFPGAHFATMPAALAERCILAGCPEGGTVLDPFTGSGTTAMVARQLGRRFVGAELNPDYFPIIESRIGQTPFDFGEVPA